MHRNKIKNHGLIFILCFVLVFLQLSSCTEKSSSLAPEPGTVFAQAESSQSISTKSSSDDSETANTTVTTTLITAEPTTTSSVVEIEIPVISSSSEQIDPPNPADNHIVVGSFDAPSGDFATPYWQNLRIDSAVNDIINGYCTIEMNNSGEFLVNPIVVKSLKTQNNAEGSRTYIFTLNENLTFDDGSPITATHYVASMLFFCSPVLKAAKGNTDNSYGSLYQGYNAYSSGASKVFTGVRLLGKYQFSVSVDKANVPSFYELSFAAIEPFALDFWLNNPAVGKVSVSDDGLGAYFSDNFTYANFAESIAHARTASKRPSSGPYKVKNFDVDNKTIVLEINPNYLGNAQGIKPSIETISFKQVYEEEMHDTLARGEIDLLLDIRAKEHIESMMELVNENPSKFAVQSYAGTVYSKIQFQCDFGPTQFVEVRQAMAYLLDRKAFLKEYAGDYGTLMNGPFTESNWFYKDLVSSLEKELNPYNYNKEAAIQVLIKGGWDKNAEGKAYTEGIRYKEVDGKMMPLIIQWASNDNSLSDYLATRLIDNPDISDAGLKIERTLMSFEEAMNYLYRDGSKGEQYNKPSYGIFNYGSTLYPTYLPIDEFSTDPEKLASGTNSSHIVDKDLENYSQSYWKTEANNREFFEKGFLRFAKRWNEVLPELPLINYKLYSFYSKKLDNFTLTPYNSVSSVLAESRVR